MHFLSYVVIQSKSDPAAQVAEIMAPFNEAENKDGIWDWYQIGGRWTGHFDGYDPDSDPANQETCSLCSGTGLRNDTIGQGARATNPEYTCNGCDGKGSRVKWPTQWGERDGDVIALDSLPEDKTPRTLFVNQTTVIDKGWAFDDPDFPGFGDEHREKIDEIDERLGAQHETAVKSALAGLRGKGFYLVVVDYHS